MGNGNWRGWTKFEPFTKYINIKNYVGHPGKEGKRNVWCTNLEGKTGFLSQAEGCEPVKTSILNYKSYEDRKNIPIGVYVIRISPATNITTKSGYIDYIGKSRSSPKSKSSKFQLGIYGRLYDHYRKIVGLPERGKIKDFYEKNYPNFTEDQMHNKFREERFSNYEELRNYFKTSDKSTKRFDELTSVYNDKLKTFNAISTFFNDNVQVSFNIYSNYQGDKPGEEISKGEGLALQAYKEKHREFPYLNDKDETKAIEGFANLI